jgi:hypothetical protein
LEEFKTDCCRPRVEGLKDESDKNA